MSALFVVVPLALIVSAGAVVAFVWSVRRGQMDDLDTPALRMLQEDRMPEEDPTPKDRMLEEPPVVEGKRDSDKRFEA